MATETIQKKDIKTVPRKMYKVIFYNDDYTSFDFVIFVLENVFNHDNQTAQIIALNIHKTGSGVVGLYTKPIADGKRTKTLKLAKENGFNEFQVEVVED